MTIDLKIPSCWKEVTTEQLRTIAAKAIQGMGREQYLLSLFCEFTRVKMVGGTSKDDEEKVTHTRFISADGKRFDLEDWQLKDFCDRLAYVWEEMPIDVKWPFKWDPYLMNTTFGRWFHADALMLRFANTGEPECLVKAMADLGDKRDGLDPHDPDWILLLKWYDKFKDWLRDRYPLVFQKAEPSQKTASSPVEARRNIMLMLNDGKPQSNKEIERSNMHDVLAALQYKIEHVKAMEEQMNKIKH